MKGVKMERKKRKGRTGRPGKKGKKGEDTSESHGNMSDIPRHHPPGLIDGVSLRRINNG
jgi:hypothetical protein